MRARTTTLLTCLLAFASASLAQVPVLLKDINPTGAGNPGGFTCIGGVVYFSANDGVNGTELWKSDGTESGTEMVKDIEPGSGSSFPMTFMDVDGTVYFTTNDIANGVRLWTTDGTESGNQLALTLADVPGLLEWTFFVPLGDRIFFRGYATDTGRELWSTDGTAAGTALFMDIHPGPNNSGFQNPMSHAGNIYFTASDGTNGSEPWMSDGTIAGTQMIAETIPGPGSSGTSPSNYTAAGNLVFFRAGTSATGDELWATDGTVAGTGVVRDIWPGTNSSLPSNFIEHNGVFHFRAYPSSGNVYIYRSDGTQAGTLAQPLYGYTNPDNLVSHDGEIWFTAVGSGYRQLWHSDGTEAGTTEITYPGSDVISPFSNSGPMMSCNGTLFFRANYLNAVGQELYTLNTSTGIAEERTDNVRLYPNPVNDVLRVNGLPANGRVSLLTMDGRMVKNMVGGNALDTHDLPAGLYVARIHDANGRLVHHQPVIMVGN